MKKIDICNRALSRISERLYEEGSVQAKHCDVHYEAAIQETLVSARWGFATRQRVLHYPQRERNGRSFQMPEDCLRLLEVNASSFQLMKDRRIFVGGEKERLEIEYISSEGFEDCSFCLPDVDPLFINAVVILLAHKMCMAVTGDKNLEVSLLQEFHQSALPNAAIINKFQDSSNDQHPLREILSRGLMRRK